MQALLARVQTCHGFCAHLLLQPRRKLWLYLVILAGVHQRVVQVQHETQLALPADIPKSFGHAMRVCTGTLLADIKCKQVVDMKISMHNAWCMQGGLNA